MQADDDSPVRWPSQRSPTPLTASDHDVQPAPGRHAAPKRLTPEFTTLHARQPAFRHHGARGSTAGVAHSKQHAGDGSALPSKSNSKQHRSDRVARDQGTSKHTDAATEHIQKPSRIRHDSEIAETHRQRQHSSQLPADNVAAAPGQAKAYSSAHAIRTERHSGSGGLADRLTFREQPRPMPDLQTRLALDQHAASAMEGQGSHAAGRPAQVMTEEEWWARRTAPAACGYSQPRVDLRSILRRDAAPQYMAAHSGLSQSGTEQTPAAKLRPPTGRVREFGAVTRMLPMSPAKPQTDPRTDISEQGKRERQLLRNGRAGTSDHTKHSPGMPGQPEQDSERKKWQRAGPPPPRDRSRTPPAHASPGRKRRTDSSALASPPRPQSSPFASSGARQPSTSRSTAIAPQHVETKLPVDRNRALGSANDNQRFPAAEHDDQVSHEGPFLSAQPAKRSRSPALHQAGGVVSKQRMRRTEGTEAQQPLSSLSAGQKAAHLEPVATLQPPAKQPKAMQGSKSAHTDDSHATECNQLDSIAAAVSGTGGVAPAEPDDDSKAAVRHPPLNFAASRASASERELRRRTDETASGQQQWAALVQHRMSIPAVQGGAMHEVLARFSNVSCAQLHSGQHSGLHSTHFNAIFGWVETGVHVAIAAGGEDAWRSDLQRSSQTVFHCSAELKLRGQRSAALAHGSD